MPIIKKAIKGVGAGIGLVSESISASKAKKPETNDGDSNRELSNEETNNKDITNADIHELPADETNYPYIAELEGDTMQVDKDHELQWDLDEAQDQLREVEARPTYQPIDEAAIAEMFARENPVPATYQEETRPPPRLQYPVVIPQRRPKTRARGFVRAYSPVLEDFDINESMFLDFLDKFNSSCMGSQWLRVINLASIPTFLLPSAISFAVSTAIQIVTKTAIEVDGRRKSNNFIDAINRDFFRPRGLYCLMMTWNPEIDDAFINFDMNDAISTAMAGGGSSLGKIKHKLKTSDAESYGNQLFPEIAPLVFPVVDRLATDEETKKKNNSFKEGALRRREFAANYFDKRAQAKFMSKNPDSALNQGPKPTFTSRYADPNHPASSGSALALLTGGHLNNEKILKWMGRGPPPDQPINWTTDRVSIISGISRNTKKGPIGNFFDDLHGRGTSASGGPSGKRPETLLQKVIKQKVIYMMIVNMPSEEELQQAREAFAQ